MILGGAVHLFAVFGVVICVASLGEVDKVAVGIGSVPVCPDYWEAAHCLIPAGSGDCHLGAGVEEHGLGEVVPGTAQPYRGFRRIAGGGDCAVAEYIAPFHILGVSWSHDETA